MADSKNHYSYRIYADPVVARSFDSDRFGGPIGEFLRKFQEAVVFQQLLNVEGWEMVDVGAGTGRLTIPLLNAGATVTACDASDEMLKVLQSKVTARSSALRVRTLDAHHLDFPDRAFRCAISFRMLLHVLDWKKALAELCRVSSDWLVIDFPPRHGFLLLTPIWHRIRSLFSSNVQAYRTISIRELRSVLAENGFQVVHQDAGLFLPFVIHRLIGSPSFSRIAERFFSASGLTRMAGSPITLFARRIQ